MQLTDRTTAPWRRPVLAPVYGAVIAFTAVAVANLFVSPAEPAPVRVCARSADPVRVADSMPESPCRTTPPDPVIDVVLVPVEVVVNTDDDRAAELSGATVTILDSAGEVQQSGVLDQSGRFDPGVPLEGSQVCLNPPAGWAVVEPPAGPDGRSCAQVSEPFADVEFQVEAS